MDEIKHANDVICGFQDPVSDLNLASLRNHLRLLSQVSVHSSYLSLPASPLRQTMVAPGSSKDRDKTTVSLDFALQAEKLGFQHTDVHNEESISSEAVVAKFVTDQDAVPVTANGDRLPTVPVHEALKLNNLRARMQGRQPTQNPLPKSSVRKGKDGSIHGLVSLGGQKKLSVSTSELPDAPLPDAVPPSKTNPLYVPPPKRPVG